MGVQRRSNLGVRAAVLAAWLVVASHSLKTATCPDSRAFMVWRMTMSALWGSTMARRLWPLCCLWPSSSVVASSGRWRRPSISRRVVCSTCVNTKLAGLPPASAATTSSKALSRRSNFSLSFSFLLPGGESTTMSSSSASFSAPFASASSSDDVSENPSSLRASSSLSMPSSSRSAQSCTMVLSSPNASRSGFMREFVRRIFLCIDDHRVFPDVTIERGLAAPPLLCASSKAFRDA
mmetsp:Transcript_5023/g.15765  ORF Transcript_5023/g.15765 Transcript_5023/m.15765 type:complete len:236 (+) Transcript_5023:1341-2048(+)